jgi:hypothetical protein
MATEWNEMEILQTLKVYVEIRDKNVDRSAAIGRLCQLLGRDKSAVKAAVLAPAKEDPLWQEERPHRGLSLVAQAIWDKYREDLPGLIAAAKEAEASLPGARGGRK